MGGVQPRMTQNQVFRTKKHLSSGHQKKKRDVRKKAELP